MTSVKTTSLTVPPRPARTSLTSASRVIAQLQTRCGPIGPVNEDADGRRVGAAAATARIKLTVPRMKSVRARIAALACPAGDSTRCEAPRTNSSTLDGSGRGCQDSGGGGSASSPNITDIRSVAATPSTMQ